jgi:hypothetical protein
MEDTYRVVNPNLVVVFGKNIFQIIPELSTVIQVGINQQGILEPTIHGVV